MLLQYHVIHMPTFNCAYIHFKRQFVLLICSVNQTLMLACVHIITSTLSQTLPKIIKLIISVFPLHVHFKMVSVVKIGGKKHYKLTTQLALQTL